jgi:hypothetical protein
MSKERSILFSGPMVRALLDGSKTQTRRVLKVPHENPLGKWEVLPWGGPNGGRTRDGKTVPYQNVIGHTRTGEIIASPYGQPGDQLWVRESFAHQYRDNTTPEKRSPEDVVYMADGLTPDPYAFGTWKPSIHMPRWASRITLEITRVRVERPQDISDADCVAEGCGALPSAIGCPMTSDPGETIPRVMFRALWESINGPDSWAANPWVWAIEFRRLP